MESQLKHPHENTRLEREDHDQHVHEEKQSVLKKVKAKAKKIKDKIKKHGHEQQPELYQQEVDDEEDEDEYEYEEMEKNHPDVGFGAGIGKDHTKLPVPTSHTYEVFRPELERLPEKSPADNLGMPTIVSLIEQTHAGNTKANISYPTEVVYEWQVSRNPTVGMEGNQGVMHHKTDLARTVEQSPNNTKIGIPTNLGPGVKLEFEKVREPSLEDLVSPKHTSNAGTFGTKVSDLTNGCGEDAPGVGSLFHSQDNKTFAEGNHDQMKSGRPGKYRDMPDDSPLLTGEAVEQDIMPQVGRHGEKLAYATAALADKIAAAKDTAASKLGYGDEKEATTHDQSDKNSYTEKASQAASLLADKATGVKDVVVSKLGNGGVEEHKTPHEPLDHDALMQHSGYMEKISGVTSTLAEKATEAKNVVASKLGYNQKGEDTSSKPSQIGSSTISDKAAHLKNVVASKLGYGVEGDTSVDTSTLIEKLRPGVEDKALSELITRAVYQGSPQLADDSNHGSVQSMGDVAAAKDEAADAKLGYGDEKGGITNDQSDQISCTKKASQAASLLSGKAAGVKDAIASKLGYVGVEEHKTPREPVDHDALLHHSGYMGNVSGVTSALAEKAVEAKNAFTSKLGYNQTGEDASSIKPTSPNRRGSSSIADEAAQVKNVVASKLGYDQSSEVLSSAQPTSPDHTSAPSIVDKATQLKNAVATKLGYGREGGISMETSQLVEKLKPGDEDKTLSELISESVYKGSPRQTDDSNQQGEENPVCNVTESEELAQRLGTSEEERRGDLTHITELEGPRKALVDNIKVAVSSLWNSGDETQTQISITQHEADERETGTGERRLQESAN